MVVAFDMQAINPITAQVACGCVGLVCVGLCGFIEFFYGVGLRGV